MWLALDVDVAGAGGWLMLLEIDVAGTKNVIASQS